METMIKGRDLREIASNLGRFADIRETAKEPRDRLLIQCHGGELKIVAGADFGTMVASVHASDQSFSAVIAAREFLTTAKAVGTKQNLALRDLHVGWAIGCSLVDTDTGETLEDFLRVSKEIPAFQRPPGPQHSRQGYFTMTGTELEMSARMFDSVADFMIGVGGRLVTGSDKVRMAGTDDYKWAVRDVGSGTYEIAGSISAPWFNASRGIGDAELSLWTGDMAVLQNDRYQTVGAYRGPDFRVPMFASQMKQVPETIEYRAVIDRTAFIKNVRELQKLDTYGRIALQWHDETGSLSVEKFADAKSGWFARGENLLDVLTSTSAKQVGIGLRIGRGQPINVRIPEWEIEIAPVELVRE